MAIKKKIVAASFGTKKYNVKNELIKRLKLKKTLELLSKTGPLNLMRCSDKQNTLTLAMQAFKKLSLPAKEKNKINNIIFVTETPVYLFPGNGFIFASRLKFKNNLTIIDLNSGCTGFIDALKIAKNFLGETLIICSETYTKYLKKFDRATSTLFSDAATAFIYNKKFKIIKLKSFYKENSYTYLTAHNKSKIIMDGASVFNFVTSDVIPALKNFLKEIQISKIKKLYVHQASQLVINTFQQKFSEYKFSIPTNLKKYGNTNASTIPLLLLDDIKKKSLKKNDYIILCSFGVGLSYNIALVKIDE